MTIAAEQMTVEAFRRFAELPENEGKLLELINGNIEEKEVGSTFPSSIAATIIFLFGLYLRGKRLGTLTATDGSYDLDEVNSPMPDVAFISFARMPEMPRRAAQGAPDLVVEIKSPTDRVRKMRQKAELYLSHGTRIVWLVFPETRTVEVYDVAADIATFGSGQELNGGDVLPGLVIKVDEIFEGI